MEANRSIWAIAAVAVVALLVVGGTLYATRPAGKLQIATSSELVRTISTQGEAKIDVKPDTATVNVGLQAKADTAEAATKEAADTLDKMLKTLDGLGIPREKVKTVNYNLRPDYSYASNTPRLIGYVVDSTLAVTLSPMSKYEQVGPMLDKLVGSGANVIQGISFSLKDEASVRQQALEQAVQDAHQRADTLAAKLGVKVVGVKAVGNGNPSSPQPRFMGYDAMKMAAASPAPATPIEAGQLQYQLTVDVDFLIG